MLYDKDQPAKNELRAAFSKPEIWETLQNEVDELMRGLNADKDVIARAFPDSEFDFTDFEEVRVIGVILSHAEEAFIVAEDNAFDNSPVTNADFAKDVAAESDRIYTRAVQGLHHAIVDTRMNRKD